MSREHELEVLVEELQSDLSLRNKLLIRLLDEINQLKTSLPPDAPKPCPVSSGSARILYFSKEVQHGR